MGGKWPIFKECRKTSRRSHNKYLIVDWFHYKFIITTSTKPTILTRSLSSTGYVTLPHPQWHSQTFSTFLKPLCPYLRPEGQKMTLPLLHRENRSLSGSILSSPTCEIYMPIQDYIHFIFSLLWKDYFFSYTRSILPFCKGTHFTWSRSLLCI